MKCLHAHYAWFLAGGDDPVGRWVADHLAEVARHPLTGPRMTVGAVDVGTNSVRLLVLDGATALAREVATTTAPRSRRRRDGTARR